MISNNFTFYQSAIGALRSGVGVLDGVPLQVAGRSASRSATRSGAPDFAGALILCVSIWLESSDTLKALQKIALSQPSQQFQTFNLK